ncbi:isoform A, partial [Brachionus plicatilis]
HEDYDPNNLLNDIAVIKLSNFITLNDYIQLACLPPETRVAYPYLTDIGAWAVGWGYESDTSQSIADKLNNVRLKIKENNECDNVQGEYEK